MGATDRSDENHPEETRHGRIRYAVVRRTNLRRGGAERGDPQLRSVSNSFLALHRERTEADKPVRSDRYLAARWQSATLIEFQDK
jgi:hypothetical protein